MEKRSNIFKKYKKLTNMSAKELNAWSKTPCSKKASLNRDPIKRNLNLLSKKKSKWKGKDMKEANKSISYLSRAKKIKSKNKVKGCGYTKNQIALKNWGFDVKKPKLKRKKSKTIKRK